MEATLTARQEAASVRATSSRTKTLGMRVSAQRSQSTARDHRTPARCYLQKSVILVLGHLPSIYVLQIFLLPFTRALHSQGLCPVLLEHRYPRQLWSVLPEPLEGLLPLVTCHPLYPLDRHQMPTCLPFLCPDLEPPYRLAPPYLGGKSTSEKQLGGEPAAKSPPIGTRRKRQSRRQIWKRRLVIMSDCGY